MSEAGSALRPASPHPPGAPGRAVSDAFRNAGLSHILALSGMHLSLVSGIAFFAGMRLFGKTKSYIFQFCAVSLFVWFAGFSPSLLRAFLCSVLLLLCSVCGIAGADTVCGESGAEAWEGEADSFCPQAAKRQQERNRTVLFTDII